MTDQRTLKNIITQQREKIQKLETELDRVTRKLDTDTNAIASQLVNMTNINIGLKKQIEEANKTLENELWDKRAEETVNKVKKILQSNSEKTTTKHGETTHV